MLAKQNTDPNNLFLTFTSGFKKFPPYTPEKMAKELNPSISQKLALGKNPMGIFASDFVDVKLANFLVSSNSTAI
jgi:hypothetical protein